MNNMYMNCNQEFYCRNAIDDWDGSDLENDNDVYTNNMNNNVNLNYYNNEVFNQDIDVKNIYFL